MGLRPSKSSKGLQALSKVAGTRSLQAGCSWKGRVLSGGVLMRRNAGRALMGLVGFGRVLTKGCSLAECLQA